MFYKSQNAIHLPLFFVVQSILVSANLYFKFQTAAEGISMSPPKNTQSSSEIRDKPFLTTPFGFAVANAVEGSAFPSVYFAQSLTNAVNRSFLKLAGKEFRKTLLTSTDAFDGLISQKVAIATTEYNQKLKEIADQTLAEVNLKTDRQIVLPLKEFRAEATFLAAHIQNIEEEIAFLQVFQKGDSGLVVLRRKRYSEGINAYHYAPVFVTEEELDSFNDPYRFSNLEETPLTQRSWELKIEKGDIVIGGTKGLLSNVSIGMITYIFNYLLSELLLKNLTTEKIEKKISEIVDKFQEKLEKDSERINEYADSFIYRPNRSDNKMFGWMINFANEIFNPFINEKKKFDEKIITASSIEIPSLTSDQLIQTNDSLKRDSLSQSKSQDKETSTSFTQHILSHRDVFFQCNGEELIWQNFEGYNHRPFVGRCVAEAIRGAFLFNENQLKTLEHIVDPQILTQIITTASKLLAIAHKGKYTPSFFKKILLTNKVIEGIDEADSVAAFVGLVDETKPRENQLKLIEKHLEIAQDATYWNLAQAVKKFTLKKFKVSPRVLETEKTSQSKLDGRLLI